jgi:hypothetical protein
MRKSSPGHQSGGRRVRGPACSLGAGDLSGCRRPKRQAGFVDIELQTVELTSRVTAREASQGIVLGSPFRAEIERLGAAALEGATAAVFEALLPWDGKDAPMSAHVATATAPSSSSHA